VEGELSRRDANVRERRRHDWPGTVFRSPARVASVAMAFLAGAAVLDAISVVTDVQMVSLLDRASAGDAVTYQEAETLDSRMAAISLLQAAALLLAAIPFIVWFRRSYLNLHALGVKWVRFRPGWAVGGWFVPFLNVARPKSIANDIWRASDPDLPRELEGPAPGGHVPALMNWWWFAFVVSGWLYGTATLMTSDDAAVDAFRAQAQTFAVADSLSFVAGILGIFVVRRITLRQEARYAMVVREGAVS
jgi:hypothetical protein